MSETVTYKGKLQKLAEGKEEIESWCKELLEYKGKSIEGSLYADYTEMATENYEKDLLVANDMLFKIVSKVDLEGDDIFQIKHLGNGEYEYLVQYYNGGCCFSEAIEYSLEKLKGGDNG